MMITGNIARTQAIDVAEQYLNKSGNVLKIKKYMGLEFLETGGLNFEYWNVMYTSRDSPAADMSTFPTVTICI